MRHIKCLAKGVPPTVLTDGRIIIPIVRASGRTLGRRPLARHLICLDSHVTRLLRIAAYAAGNVQVWNAARSAALPLQSAGDSKRVRDQGNRRRYRSHEKDKMNH